jgi:hypothetical protein
MTKIDFTEDEIQLIRSLCYRAVKSATDAIRLSGKDTTVYKLKQDEIDKCNSLEQKLDELMKEAKDSK